MTAEAGTGRIGAKSNAPPAPTVCLTQHLRAGAVLVSILSITAWLMLGSCATAPPQQRSPIATALLGKTKQELVTCAGAPLKEFAQGDATVLTYYKEAPELEESFMGSKSSLRFEHRHGCRARISLREDRVEGIEYESVPATFSSEDHCDEIFQACSR